MFISLTKKIALVFISIFGFNFTIFSQEAPVRLIEEKQKKRTILFIQNDTDTEKSVFLKITPTGYRRSANKPIIKIIPAKSKVQMMILIPLTDVESYYTYDLIVNEQLEAIKVNRNNTPQKQASVSSIMKSETIIFTKNDCEKCIFLISKLKEKHIKFREVNIDKKNRYRDYLWELLDQNGYDKNSIGVPLAIVKKTLQYPINDVDDFILTLAK
ncbi:glutaredoxin domain-containing protein [Aquimarina gracilis]|uniref:Glutaredoxin domain-containing protein n=1 Tax=Aquimarina gracilis TaxID=874422 RepID=A0ABU5ZR18_9FLAO|nr:glutaredoxin domain-containing protein [Aquimarina gracilis]MEB3344516.1 glutaredoxin domain-containing protein [Aquimarina gracilis]